MTDTRYIVSVSGGKDSTALYLWAKEQFGPDGYEAVFADTGHEHPVTYNYLRNLPEMAQGPAIVWVKADFRDRLTKQGKPVNDSPFLDLIMWKGRAPMAGMQFCTTELKLRPMKEWLDKTCEGDDRPVVRVIGIRAAESEARKNLPERQFDDYFGCDLWRPLIRWSIEEVLWFLEKHQVPPNPLYAAGFTRVGCFPCIHARKSELALLPDWAWDKLAEWECITGKTWFPAGFLPGDKSPLTSINAVRRWCKTARGGKQFDLFAPDAADVPTCMSTWGVCE